MTINALKHRTTTTQNAASSTSASWVGFLLFLLGPAYDIHRNVRHDSLWGGATRRGNTGARDVRETLFEELLG